MSACECVSVPYFAVVAESAREFLKKLFHFSEPQFAHWKDEQIAKSLFWRVTIKVK